MKLLSDLSFLLKYYDREDLQYFYAQLKYRISQTVKDETTGNERLAGYIWRLMAALIERVLPQRFTITRISTKDRLEFRTLAVKRIHELAKQLNTDITLSKAEKDQIMFSISSLKLLIAIVEQEELF